MDNANYVNLYLSLFLRLPSTLDSVDIFIMELIHVYLELSAIITGSMCEIVFGGMCFVGTMTWQRVSQLYCSAHFWPNNGICGFFNGFE